MNTQQGSSFWAILLVVLVVVVLVIAVMPNLLTSSRGLPQPGWTSLKSLACAQADFRANDRDWNHVNDFWAGDVKGLYTMTSAAVKGAGEDQTLDPSIKLIEQAVAAADADPIWISAGGENAPLSRFAVPSAKAGYWYAAMRADGDAVYRQDTGGDPPMGRCHNLQRFGYVAFPARAEDARYVCIINESNVIYCIEDRRNLTPGGSAPPGLGVLPPEYLNWPSIEERNRSWRRLD